MLNKQGGVTREKYIMICQQMNVEPDPARFPIEMRDLPIIVQTAFDIYGRLSDRFITLGMDGSIFGGKDYSSLSVLYDIFDISDTRDKKLVLDILNHLDASAVKKAQAERKRRAAKK